MSSGHRVRARISLNSTDTPSTGWTLRSGTRSLLLQFRGLERDEPITLGGVVSTNNDVALTLGLTDLDVVIHFWADQAIAAAQPGAKFVIWYGREVGRGEVIDVLNATPRSR